MHVLSYTKILNSQQISKYVYFLNLIYITDKSHFQFPLHQGKILLLYFQIYHYMYGEINKHNLFLMLYFEFPFKESKIFSTQILFLEFVMNVCLTHFILWQLLGRKFHWKLQNCLYQQIVINVTEFKDALWI